MKLELKKSLVIAGLGRKTGGEKLPSKGTMGNSYTGVQLFYASHLLRLYLAFMLVVMKHSFRHLNT